MDVLIKFLIQYQDKVLHFTISALLVFVLYIIAVKLNINNALLFASIATLQIGFIKECYDLMHSNFDWYDLLWNLIGVIFGVILLKTII